jgi:hypothetical protein
MAIMRWLCWAWDVYCDDDRGGMAVVDRAGNVMPELQMTGESHLVGDERRYRDKGPIPVMVGFDRRGILIARMTGLRDWGRLEVLSGVIRELQARDVYRDGTRWLPVTGMPRAGCLCRDTRPMTGGGCPSR